MSTNRLLENDLKPEEVNYFRQVIENNQNFLLTTHVYPDGDALGSELSLFYLLKELGKNVLILNHSPIPELYQFLNPDGFVKQFNPKDHEPLLQNIEVFFVLDIGDWDRLDDIGAYIKNLRTKAAEAPIIICIDHHPHEKAIGDFDIIYPQASSTGEILFLLQESIGVPFDVKTAQALYTAILTDTGSFRFSNTTVNSHVIAGYLLNLGVNHSSIYQQVYENEPLTKIKLLAELLENLNFECDHHVIWFQITREMLKRYNLEPYEIEGVSEFPRRIKGVQISILFMEIDEHRTKVSFRSTGKIAINGFAQFLGGGGHPYASGALITKPLDQTVRSVIGKVRQFYQQEQHF